MSGASSNAAAWFTRLEPVEAPVDLPHRADDPRLGEVVEFWRGAGAAIRPGRAVLVGFPQDDGVRRNGGREGAAEGPTEIRRWLYRLTPWNAQFGTDLSIEPPLDAGNIRITGGLEDSQQALGEVVGAILQCGAVPIVLGGGHETAYGHYLGYVAARRPVGILNIDAHLDVRPCIDGLGHSGSPFRQAMEHPTQPLRHGAYACLGAQPHSLSREHLRYVRDHGGIVRWHSEVMSSLRTSVATEIERLHRIGCQFYVSIDADVVQQAEVPGVSAPNPHGLSGFQVIDAALSVGLSPQGSSLDLVEVSPRFDRDGQSARWAALVIWHFLIGLAQRVRSPAP